QTVVDHAVAVVVHAVADLCLGHAAEGVLRLARSTETVAVAVDVVAALLQARQHLVQARAPVAVHHVLVALAAGRVVAPGLAQRQERPRPALLGGLALGNRAALVDEAVAVVVELVVADLLGVGRAAGAGVARHLQGVVVLVDGAVAIVVDVV